MTKYFTACTTLEELKSEYKRLALEHHPDRGGDLETMQAINAQYDEAFPLLKNIHRNHEGETYTKESTEAPDEFKDLVAILLRMNGVIVEIIGCFVWLSGNTKEHKEQIKTLGFRWSKTKSMWYKSPENYKRFGKSDYDINTIRSMYGSDKYKSVDSDLKQVTA